MREIIILARKDLLLLVRDRAGFFFTFFFPLLMAVFFGTIFSGGGDGGRRMAILVVDEDSTAGSAKFIGRLSASDALDVAPARRAEAAEMVRLGKRVAYVVVRKGFGAASENPFRGNPPTVELGVDPSRRAEAGLLGGVLMQFGAEGLQEVFSDPEAMRRAVSSSMDSLLAPGSPEFRGKEGLSRFLGEVELYMGDTTRRAADSAGVRGLVPLKIEQAAIVRERSGPGNAYEVSFPQGIVWGMIGCAAAFGISLVMERTRGTLLRLRIAPLSKASILAGKALSCFVLTLVVSVCLLVVAWLAFGVVPASAGQLAAAVLSISTAFVGIMMLLAVLGKTERSAGGIGWAALLIMSMIGGGMIPLFLMPAWMQAVSNFSPVKWSILALEGALWRHFSAAEMALPCGILIGIGLVAFFLGVRAFRWED